MTTSSTCKAVSRAACTLRTKPTAKPSYVANQINESLLAYETGGTAVVPGLAESYEASDDGLTWTFHLRPGVKFHDGST